VKLVVQVGLLPTPVQAAGLQATLRACNEAATWVSETAFERGEFKNFALRQQVYGEVKSRWDLGAQAAQHVIKKTCDAYATLKANLRAGNLGRPGSRRHRRAAEKPIVFRPRGAQPYDDRMLSWQIPDRTVSIWTTSGRVKDVAFTASVEQLATLALYRKGESDLLQRDGMWFLNATCEVPEAPLNTDPVDFLGIDLGIVNIATTSDGEIMAGRELNRTRVRERGLRAKLWSGFGEEFPEVHGHGVDMTDLDECAEQHLPLLAPDVLANIPHRLMPFPATPSSGSRSTACRRSVNASSMRCIVPSVQAPAHGRAQKANRASSGPWTVRPEADRGEGAGVPARAATRVGMHARLSCGRSRTSSRASKAHRHRCCAGTAPMRRPPAAGHPWDRSERCPGHKAVGRRVRGPSSVALPAARSVEG
jgi:hypothetical protein